MAPEKNSLGRCEEVSPSSLPSAVDYGDLKGSMAREMDAGVMDLLQRGKHEMPVVWDQGYWASGVPR